MSTSQLPTPRAVVTSLLNSISAHAVATSASASASASASNTLRDAAPAIKPLLLTLHVLFPNELLPALDVLDRRLVTRFRLAAAPSASEQAAAQDISSNDGSTDTGVYFVRSAQQPSSHSRFTNPLATHYEVRPLAWNCSCPAFAFSAFPARDLPSPPITAPKDAETDGEWSFGGLLLAHAGVPVCKHLLACVLVERCPALFGEGVEEKVVEREELAGWCAGWGG